MEDMMEKHVECTPGFHFSSASWYAPAAQITRPQIMVGLYADDGSGAGEKSLEWEGYGVAVHVFWEGYGVAVHVFHDAWSLFTRPEFAGLWTWLAEQDGRAVSAADVVAELLRLGFNDLTQYERPA
jgi:hypothetical protein